MSKNVEPNETNAVVTAASWTREKTAWWITFSVLTLSIVTILGLWD